MKSRNRIVLGAAACAALLLAHASAMATVYVVDRSVGGGSVTGFIETDGTVGILLASNIVDWNLQVRNGAETVNMRGPLSGNDSQFGFVGIPIEATLDGNLTADFQGVAGAILFCVNQCNFGNPDWTFQGPSATDYTEFIRNFDSAPDQARSILIGTTEILGTVAVAPDSDGDGVPDDTDNCTFVPNGDQFDADGDGFGNLCDPDLNGDCIVNALDLGLLRVAFFSADPVADFNGDGVVNSVDLGLMRVLFFQAPGPNSTGSCP